MLPGSSRLARCAPLSHQLDAAQRCFCETVKHESVHPAPLMSHSGSNCTNSLVPIAAKRATVRTLLVLTAFCSLGAGRQQQLSEVDPYTTKVMGPAGPQEKRIRMEVENLERDTGVKLRVLAQNYPSTPGSVAP